MESCFSNKWKGLGDLFLTAVSQCTEIHTCIHRDWVRHSKEEPKEELYISCNQLFSFYSMILHGEDNLSKCLISSSWGRQPLLTWGEIRNLISYLKISQQVILGEVQKALWSPFSAVPHKVHPLSQSYLPWEWMSVSHQIYGRSWSWVHWVMAQLGFHQEIGREWQDTNEPCNLLLWSHSDKCVISKHSLF